MGTYRGAWLGWLLALSLAGGGETQRLAFVEREEDGLRLKIWQPGRPQGLEVARDIGGPWGWSPQGRWIAFLNTRRQVGVVDADIGRARILEVGEVLRFGWAPQGVLCGLKAGEGPVVGDYWEWEPERQTARVLAPLCAHWVWSPDGERVAILTVPREQARAQRVDEVRGQWKWRAREEGVWHPWNLSNALAAFAWSPDGQWALAVQGKLDYEEARSAPVLLRRIGRLTMLSLLSASPARPFLREEYEWVEDRLATDGEFSWAPDGNWFVYFLTDIRSPLPLRLSPSVYGYCLISPPDGSQRREWIFLKTPSPAVRRSLQWLGERLLWATVQDSAWVLNAYSTRRKAQEALAFKVFWFEVSPRGDQVAILAEERPGRPGVFLWNGEGAPSLWLSAPELVRLAWSPDGQWLAAGSRAGKVWVGRVEGKPEEREVEGWVEEVRCSVGGEVAVLTSSGEVLPSEKPLPLTALWVLLPGRRPMRLSSQALSLGWEPR